MFEHKKKPPAMYSNHNAIWRSSQYLTENRMDFHYKDWWKL